jgi:hypothetical protein
MLPRRRADAKIAAWAGLVPGSAAPASLRAKARQPGVSPEAVRQAMRAAGAPTDLATRNARIRAMAERGVPWIAIAKAFGLSPSGIRRVCWDLPRRPSGPRPRKRTAG